MLQERTRSDPHNRLLLPTLPLCPAHRSSPRRQRGHVPAQRRSARGAPRAVGRPRGRARCHPRSRPGASVTSPTPTSSPHPRQYPLEHPSSARGRRPRREPRRRRRSTTSSTVPSPGATGPRCGPAPASRGRWNGVLRSPLRTPLLRLRTPRRPDVRLRENRSVALAQRFPFVLSRRRRRAPEAEATAGARIVSRVETGRRGVRRHDRDVGRRPGPGAQGRAPRAGGAHPTRPRRAFVD